MPRPSSPPARLAPTPAPPLTLARYETIDAFLFVFDQIKAGNTALPPPLLRAALELQHACQVAPSYEQHVTRDSQGNTFYNSRPFSGEVAPVVTGEEGPFWREAMGAADAADASAPDGETADPGDEVAAEDGGTPEQEIRAGVARGAQ